MRLKSEKIKRSWLLSDESLKDSSNVLTQN